MKRHPALQFQLNSFASPKVFQAYLGRFDRLEEGVHVLGRLMNQAFHVAWDCISWCNFPKDKSCNQ